MNLEKDLITHLFIWRVFILSLDHLSFLLTILSIVTQLMLN